MLPQRCEPARTVAGVVTGLKATEAAGRAAAPGGSVITRKTVDTLATKMFGKAPARRAIL
jgi:hypothetical protein